MRYLSYTLYCLQMVIVYNQVSKNHPKFDEKKLSRFFLNICIEIIHAKFEMLK